MFKKAEFESSGTCLFHFSCGTAAGLIKHLLYKHLFILTL